MNEIIIINDLEFKVKKDNTRCTAGRSHYVFYYKENAECSTIIYGSSKEVLKNKLERIAKKELISNKATKKEPVKYIANDNDYVEMPMF